MSESDLSFCKRVFDLLKGSLLLGQLAEIGEIVADEEMDRFCFSIHDFYKAIGEVQWDNLIFWERPRGVKGKSIKERICVRANLERERNLKAEESNEAEVWLVNWLFVFADFG